MQCTFPRTDKQTSITSVVQIHVSFSEGFLPAE